MWTMFYMIGRTQHLQIIVFGEVSHVTMSPSMSLPCKSFFFVPFCVLSTVHVFNWQLLKFILFSCYSRILLFHCLCVWFSMIFSNLSGLNLDGEISPAIGELKFLLTMYCSPSYYCFNI